MVSDTCFSITGSICILIIFSSQLPFVSPFPWIQCDHAGQNFRYPGFQDLRPFMRKLVTAICLVLATL